MSVDTDPFEQFNPKDGFHVTSVTVAGTFSLHCCTYVDGSLASFGKSPVQIELYSCSTDDPEKHAAGERLFLVLDQVARYLRTGGKWEELIPALQRIRSIAPGGLVFDGYHLLMTRCYLEGDDFTWRHVFVRDNSNEAVLWIEPYYNQSGSVVGGFLERTTLEELNERREEEDARKERKAQSRERRLERKREYRRRQKNKNSAG